MEPSSEEWRLPRAEIPGEVEPWVMSIAHVKAGAVRKPTGAGQAWGDRLWGEQAMKDLTPFLTRGPAHLPARGPP